MRLTNQQVRDQFEELLKEVEEYSSNSIDRSDSIAMREDFNIYVDSLQKDGLITEHQANIIANPY